MVHDPLILAHKDDLIALASRYGVEMIKVFGSRARGDARDDSDVDLLVSFAPQASWRDHVQFRMAVDDLFGRHVDVATPQTLHWAMKQKITNAAEELWTASNATTT